MGNAFRALGGPVAGPYKDAMALHLLKLAVGAASIADIEAHVEARLEARRADGRPAEVIHTTRMVPKRVDEILDGGSLFWVVRGQVAARQSLLAVRPFSDGDGIGRCELVLAPAVVAVAPRPCRPFQGWRYLPHESAPVDLSTMAGAGELPESLRFALRELCLI